MEKLGFKQVPFIYLYDGTFDGLLSIVFKCFVSKTIPQNVFSEKEYLYNMLDKTEKIETNYEHSERIFNGIVKNISYDTLYNNYYAFLSNGQNKEINILKYIIYGFTVGSRIETMLSIDFVLNVQLLRKNMLHESHRLKGLVRFSQIGENLFYSSIHPDNNVIENLGHHFIKRLPTQNFIIHDKNRELAFLYNTIDYQIIDSINLKIPNITQEEKQYQELWKAFFKTIAIKERTNKKLQMQFMPKKYWKDIFETQ